MKHFPFFAALSALFACILYLGGCNAGSKTPAVSERVVLYCSVDEVYAKPIIKKLEEQTGLRIDVLYDTEAAKTAGLANRIRAERARPRGDVFWSSALLQTLLLGREGLLLPYVSPSARYISPEFKDSSGMWTGIGVRARVIVYHQGIVNPPRTLEDLLQPRFKNKVGISNPQFGTGSDWVAALATRWGAPKTLDYFRTLKKNGVKVLPGNSVVADKVHRGELLVGITDTDDYFANRIKTSDGIRVQDAEKTGQDMVLVPGSVAILKGAPHRAAAQKLVDALLLADTEEQLVKVMPGVELTRRWSAPTGSTQAAPSVTGFQFPSALPPEDTSQWVTSWDKVREPLAQILLRN